MFKNIIIGIDAYTDIKELLSLGIKQFYFGYVPSKYHTSYGSQTSLNRRYRQKEQFEDLDKIYEVIEEVHRHDATIYLALNGFTNNDVIMKYSQEVYTLFYQKVDAIIVANIAMAQFLKEQAYGKIVLSNLFGIYNTQAVQFFKNQFKPYKMILPRDIELSDIEKIVTTFPEDKFECFLYGDNCRFSESFCFSEHGYDANTFGSLCHFAFTNKKPIVSAKEGYKQIVKHAKLTRDEKVLALHKKPLSIETLLDDIALNIFEFNAKNIAKSLAILNRYDTAYLQESKTIFVRLCNLLDTLEFDVAKEILQRVKNSKEVDYYASFHNLNHIAILKTIAFFDRFDNIVSYKVPSRGRAFHKILSELEHNKGEYDYRESQYQL